MATNRGTVDPVQILILAGLYRSASTWLYNVVLEILKGEGVESRMSAFYADQVEILASSIGKTDEIIAIKTHAPDPTIKVLAKLGAPVIFSIRDPFDCVASLVKQFGHSFEDALQIVTESIKACTELIDVARHQPLILVYEEIFARGPQTVQAIANCIGHTIDERRAIDIANLLSPSKVRSYIDDLVQKGLITQTFDFDPITHWHPRHVGSGKTGRFREDLNELQIAKVRFAARRFCERFGYIDSVAAPKLPLNAAIDFIDTGIAYCDFGFSYPESWGIWTNSLHARVYLPLMNDADKVVIQIVSLVGPSLSQSNTRSKVQILVNNERYVSMDASEIYDRELITTIAIKDFDARFVQIDFVFENVQSMKELGISEDDRLLGFGIRRILIDACSAGS